VPRPAVAPTSRYAHLPRVLPEQPCCWYLQCLLVTFLTVKVLRHSAAEQAQMPAYSQDARCAGIARPFLHLATATPDLPYSIVPGGVRDARELQSVASHDPVVAQTLFRFIASLRRAPSRLEKPLKMYVSYRRNNNVYWTRNRMVIPAGENFNFRLGKSGSRALWKSSFWPSPRNRFRYPNQPKKN